MKKKIYAMIPARIGSKRLRKKNLALINKKPLINYVIEAAKQSRVFDKIILNSDHKIFKKIAKENKIQLKSRKITPQERKITLSLLDQGLSTKEIAKKLSRSATTIQRIVKAYGKQRQTELPRKCSIKG